jgi:hypothetical protein
VVLLLSLLVLLLLAVMAVTVSRGSLLQLHMAGNEETRMAAMQRVLAAVDNVLAVGAGMGPDTVPGHRICATVSIDSRCDEHSIELDSKLEPTGGSTLDVAVVRLTPLEARIPPLAEDRASSAVAYRVARFEISSRYDGREAGLGGAEIIQGLLLRLVHRPQ